jgi:DNA-binding response OmpR family regulator
MSARTASRAWPVDVLICGADRTLSDLVARNLDRRAFTVRQAPLAPLDATTMPPGVAPGIVVADLDDADPDGWRHAAWLRAAFPYVPLVLLAHSWPSTTVIQRFQPCRFVRKPFAIDELLAECDAARLVAP